MTREAPAAGRPEGHASEPGRPQRPASAPLLGQDVRRTLLALLASMLGAVPLCELFLDRGWLIDVWLTMVIAVAPAAWMRRNRPPAAGQVWVGVILLVPWLTVNFVREHAFLGFIPLRGAWKDIGDLLTDLHNTTTDSVAPVHTTVAVRLAVCALLGLIAALVDLLAVVGRRGALAGVPLLIVFTVSGAVPRHPVSWVWFAFSAVGFLILLALDSSDDLHRWGHYVARSRSAGRRRLGSYSGQRIAAVAILLAVALPLAIPADSRNLIANWFHNSPTQSDDFGAGEDIGAGNGSGANGIDPFSGLRGQLIRPQKLNLLDVTVSGSEIGGAKDPQVFYLRSNVLSNFTGDGWRPQKHGATQSLDDTDFASSPGTAFVPNTVKYRADIEVTGLRSNPPIFASPQSITGVDGDTVWSAQDMLMLGNKVDSGQRIVEQVAQPSPTVAELRAATDDNPAMRRWTALNVPISAFVRQTTATVLGKATTPYDKARAITQFFANPANNFQYSLSTGTSDSSDALADFLRNRIGFCQQYAATMAVMLRLADVPARVVLGYAHPEPDADGKFTVTSYDAHAWVEAYFDGIGWIPFDPTPVEGISGGKAADLPWAKHDVASDAPTATTTNEPSASLPQRSNRPGEDPSSAPAAAPQTGGGSATPLLVLAVIVLALVVVALVPAAVRWRRRRHRLHRARAGDTDALWRELQDTATDLGYAWSSARTPRQVASWLGGTKDDPTGALRSIAEAVERDRYAPAGVTATRSDRDLTADLRTVIAGLQSRRSSRERARAIFWPASLSWAHLPIPARWAPAAAGLRRH